MPRYHTTSQGNIPFTAEEEAEWDARELIEVKKTKIAELETAYDAAIHADIVHNAKLYTCDERKMEIISRFSALNAVPPNMYIEAKNGEQVGMTLAELRSLGVAMATRGLSEHQNLTAKKLAVNSALTIEDVNSIIY